MTTMTTGEKYAVLNMGEKLTRYQPVFDDLGPDAYHPAEQGGRTRRLAQYHAVYDPQTRRADIVQLRTQLFLQGRTNKLTGSIERDFSALEADMRAFIEAGFHAVDERWPLAGYQNEWMVNLHTVRVHAEPAVRGVPVPEGVHKDGADFVVMGCVARQDVKGGISQVHENDDEPPVYGVTLMPGDALVVDDREVFHMVTPLIAQSGHGYRDMILMGFHLWSHGKYRGDWKEQTVPTP
ncbi:MAG: 2OG-Fe dioxygenase family protein [Pseudomonadota bacterium]